MTTFTTPPRILVMGSLDFPGLDPAFEALAQTLHSTAMNSLDKLGATAELVNINAHPRPDVQKVLDEVDGLMILGGGDVDPTLYGAETGHANAYGVDRSADEYLIQLINDARARSLPILGICRGSQIINVALGGSLIVDIDDWAIHRGSTAEEVFVQERVQIVEGTRLARMCGESSLFVMNGHHQAVRDLGVGLVCSAVADDGVIEAIEAVDEWIVGVQWHPEHLRADAAARERLFLAFMRECVVRS